MTNDDDQTADLPAASEEKSDGQADPEAEVAAPARVSLVKFDLDVFLRGKALWAVNYFVLWPIGLTLTVGVDDAEVTVGPLDVKEYPYPDDELAETIDQSKESNQADYDVFLGFVRARLLAMKPEERALALDRYTHHLMASAEQIVVAVP